MHAWQHPIIAIITPPLHHSTPGLQGSGCLKDLQASGRFRLRTVTRNAKSAAAQALAAQGVEVLQGTLLDRPFLDQAMAGVAALFLATFSDHDGTEVTQGKNLGDAAVAAGVPLVVFSGGERIGVDAMDNKIKIEEYLRGLPLRKAVYLHTAFFYENLATKRGTRRVKVCGLWMCGCWGMGSLSTDRCDAQAFSSSPSLSLDAQQQNDDAQGGGGPRHGPARRLPLLHPAAEVEDVSCAVTIDVPSHLIRFLFPKT